MQLVNGLLQVGLDHVCQRLGVIARSLPFPARKVRDMHAALFKISRPVVVPGDDANAADGGGGWRVHPPGSGGEVVGGGGAQAVGVSVDRFGGLPGQP